MRKGQTRQERTATFSGSPGVWLKRDRPDKGVRILWFSAEMIEGIPLYAHMRWFSVSNYICVLVMFHHIERILCFCSIVSTLFSLDIDCIKKETGTITEWKSLHCHFLR